MSDLFILDINAVIHRCFHAVSELTTSKGISVNAVYGTCMTLSRIFQKFQVKNCVVAWDDPDGSKRRELYPEYKANRTEKDPLLAVQYPYVAKLIRALGLHSFWHPGWEADDVIATLVERYADDFTVYIVSGDKDLTQLVEEKVLMYDFGKDITYDEAAVCAKWGVYPNQMLDYLALVGDSSDNIPGVKGVGPKKAVALLEKFESLADIYLHLDDIKGKMRENIENSRENAYLSHDLAKLRRDLVLPVPKSVFGPRPGTPELAEFFNELDFREPESRFPGLYGVDPAQEEGQVMF
jgi:DNA polymerase-1